MRNGLAAKKVSLDGAATRTSSREALTGPRALCNKNPRLEYSDCAVKPAWSNNRFDAATVPVCLRRRGGRDRVFMQRRGWIRMASRAL